MLQKRLKVAEDRGNEIQKVQQLSGNRNACKVRARSVLKNMMRNKIPNRAHALHRSYNQFISLKTEGYVCNCGSTTEWRTYVIQLTDAEYFANIKTQYFNTP